MEFLSLRYHENNKIPCIRVELFGERQTNFRSHDPQQLAGAFAMVPGNAAHAFKYILSDRFLIKRSKCGAKHSSNANNCKAFAKING